MTNKKSKVLTFICSLIPGAGEMYMGFMKQGVSIMTVFWGLVFFAAYLNLGPVLFVLPILWCYSFFNVNNLRRMNEEEFYAVEDEYLFRMDHITSWKKILKNQNKILAIILIVIGVSVLWNNVTEFIYQFFPHWFGSVIYDIPQILIAVLLIGGGVLLIRGKKITLQEEEDAQNKEDMDMSKEESK
ncbi:MAG: hypothetical protein RR139_11055 [Lachnospiraceae bacterium]